MLTPETLGIGILVVTIVVPIGALIYNTLRKNKTKPSTYQDEGILEKFKELEIRVKEMMYDSERTNNSRIEFLINEIVQNRKISEEKFGQIDERFSELDDRFGEIFERFREIGKRFGEIDKKSDGISNQVNTLKSLVNQVVKIEGGADLSKLKRIDSKDMLEMGMLDTPEMAWFRSEVARLDIVLSPEDILHEYLSYSIIKSKGKLERSDAFEEWAARLRRTNK